MPTPRSSGSSPGSSRRPAQPSSSPSASDSTQTPADPGRSARSSEAFVNASQELLSRVSKQLDLVMLTRERIQETLDEAAERGRVTRTDANVLVSELVQRGRQQSEELLREVEQLVGRGRDQLESATRKARQAEPVERLVRGADRARRTVGAGPEFPIVGYDDLSAKRVQERLSGLNPAQLRQVREHERRHANRKTVLAAIERALA